MKCDCCNEVIPTNATYFRGETEGRVVILCMQCFQRAHVEQVVQADVERVADTARRMH